MHPSTCAYSAVLLALCGRVRDASRSITPEAPDDLARDATKATMEGNVVTAVCAWVKKGSWPMLMSQDLWANSEQAEGSTCRWGTGPDWRRVQL